MTDQIEFYEDSTSTPNPLEWVEDVLNDHNWVYSRMTNEELIVDIAGKACNYRLLFVWQDHMNALQICCQYEMEISANNMAMAASALMDMNAALWMGHFELTKESNAPCYRYSCLLRDQSSKSGYEHIEDLVDIALTQCERFQTVFALLSQENGMDSQSLSFAMMETAGES